MKTSRSAGIVMSRQPLEASAEQEQSRVGRACRSSVDAGAARGLPLPDGGERPPSPLACAASLPRYAPRPQSPAPRQPSERPRAGRPRACCRSLAALNSPAHPPPPVLRRRSPLPRPGRRNATGPCRGQSSREAALPRANVAPAPRPASRGRLADRPPHCGRLRRDPGSAPASPYLPVVEVSSQPTRSASRAPQSSSQSDVTRRKVSGSRSSMKLQARMEARLVLDTTSAENGQSP